MTTLATYATAAGERELVLVRVPDGPPRFVLIDAQLHVPLCEADPRIVDDDLHSEQEARALAADYVPRAELDGAPAVDYMPWDALDDEDDTQDLAA